MPYRKPSSERAFGEVRRSRLIRWTSIFLGVFALVALVGYQVAGLTEWHRLVGESALLLGCALAWLLCRAGQVRHGARALVWGSLIAISFVAYATGGYRSTAANGFLSVVAFTGLLLGLRDMIVVAILSLAVMVTFFALGQTGMLPAPATSHPLILFASATIPLIVGSLLFFHVARETRLGVAQEAALRGDLERANDELEQKVAARTHELSVAKEAAERASRAKGAFLANMSHEIRTPIHAIVGLAEVVQRESTDPRARERLALVAQASQHLLTLINNVLDVSKIESGKLELAATEVRIGDVVERVLSILRGEARNKGLQLRAELDAASGGPVQGDATRLAQVLLNFAANAVKFTPAGSVVLRCRKLEAGLFRFEVEDSGIGIAPADQARIFDAFEQVDAALTRARSGSGLGLAINRYLVRAMGGEVGLRSTPGAGSLFWFTARLPPAPESIAAAPAPAAGVGASEAEALLRGALAGARLLVVDDNEVNRIVVRAQLDAVGIAADEAADGAQAVEMAGRDRYDLILMDVHMPTLDGIEATRRIRRIDACRDTPIIALTADVFASERQRCTDAGMTDHLAKPLQAAQLYAALARWLAPVPGRGR